MINHEKVSGYRECINKGLIAIRNLGSEISNGTGTRSECIEKLKDAFERADAIVVGAGSGLSTSAGLTYSGERFERYFFDFAQMYGITDMYSGGFYPFPDMETFWAWWARHIYYNRYIDAPKPVYQDLLKLLEGRDYFVITTNVDHQFQRAGFDKKRLFYTQGDYGLLQSMNPKIRKTYDNEEWVMKAMEYQGFVRDADGVYQVPEQGNLCMRIPTDMIPKCPDDGSDMVTNLRADDSFVEDEGWQKASMACAEYLHSHENQRVLYLDLGIGENTPVIIKYPFWQFTSENEKSTYACINYGTVYCPKKIEKRSICIRDDIGEVLKAL